ncbi:MAG: hypothetical protein KAS63_01460 [Candidatus Heimdallarchaeota archaeon]|nr:hypothetical protein [Candidatus Heimdallarchaeota archaeon]MCK4954005.1 hypothetical protein [Candidatus Heimdallarchaeota archaeon]
MNENSPPPYSEPTEEDEEKLKKEKKEKELYPPKPPRPVEPTQPPTASIPTPPPLPKEISQQITDDTRTVHPRPQSVVLPEEQRRTPLPSPVVVPEEEKETKRRSFFWWGCLFFLLWNITLMFLLEATLQPRNSLAAGIIAYSLGLLGLVIFSLLVNNIKKIAIAFPVLLLIVFGLSILFHVTNLPAYNPLSPLSERAFFVVESIKNSTNLFGTEGIIFGSITVENLELWSLAAYAVDFIIILLIFMVGSLSLVWFIKLVTSKKEISTSFLIVLALVLFTIGLVLSPVIHLSLAGFIDFGGNTLVGANHIAGSVEIMGSFGNATQEDINRALENFLLAEENIRNARNSINMFSFIFGFIKITEILLHFMDASLILLSGVEPLINGSYQIFQGFQDVSESLNQSDTSETLATQGFTIKKSVVNESLFQIGVNKVEAGLNELGSSMNLLYEAFDEINLANISDIYSFLDRLPFQTDEIQLYIVDIEEYIQSFSKVPGVIEILVEHPIKNELPSRYATLTHFLYGAYNLINAADYISDNSAYNGTAAFFDDARSNFSLVSDQLARDEAQQMIGSETIFFNETLSFIYDMTKISANISSYGSDIGVVFSGLNDTLSNFDQGYENITSYPEISNELDGLVNLSESLNTTAHEIDYDISLMKIKSENETYGVFSEPSQQIVSSLEKFDLITNAENSFNIAKALFHLFNSMGHLKDMHDNIIIGEQQFVNDSLYVEANNSFIMANVSLYSSMSEMDSAISYMNKTAEGDMVQLEETRTMFLEIKNTLESVIIYFNNLLSLASLGPVANLSYVSGNSTLIIDTLSNVNNQLSDVMAQ